MFNLSKYRMLIDKISISKNPRVCRRRSVTRLRIALLSTDPTAMMLIVTRSAFAAYLLLSDNYYRRSLVSFFLNSVERQEMTGNNGYGI
jgi:hypothetical protein